MTTHSIFNLKTVDYSWHIPIQEALKKMDPIYLKNLVEEPNWLPGPHKLFNAFSLPIDKVKYVLFGESPYPRPQSANGYAFWDADVKDLWSPSGLNKTVNRATSLRNIIKMLLVAEGLLEKSQTGQEAIATLNKTKLVQTNSELFSNFIHHGFLLLNASLVFEATQIPQHAKAWQPFVKHILYELFKQNPHLKLLLFGNIANRIDKIITNHQGEKLYAEHPYNLSFINNPRVLEFFKPHHLLRASAIVVTAP